MWGPPIRPDTLVVMYRSHEDARVREKNEKKSFFSFLIFLSQRQRRAVLPSVLLLGLEGNRLENSCRAARASSHLKLLCMSCGRIVITPLTYFLLPPHGISLLLSLSSKTKFLSDMLFSCYTKLVPATRCRSYLLCLFLVAVVQLAFCLSHSTLPLLPLFASFKCVSTV